MFKKQFVAATVAAAVMGAASITAYAEDALKLESDEQKYSYSLGYILGKQLDQQFSAGEAEFDRELMLRGLGDVMLGKETVMTDEEIEATMKAVQEKAMAEAKKLADEAQAKSQAFLDENKKKEGVKVTDSGLQYKVLTEGKGEMPKEEDTVVVNYKGTLIDGSEFDSSYKRGEPTEFPLAGIIPGWKEALQLMKEGGKWEVVIPSELAYGERGAGGRIGPNEVLVFEIELVEIKK
ncbi:MAG: FKBP-type peptidyl-prolyl cis-trans isomerase [Pseudomonadota bacterium]|nr:FKBP-type peptidyl-prolyl cis-trans isomerase [Pseudomonadota bacterium]